MGRLGSGRRVVGRLGSRVWFSASFHIFALTAGGGDVLGGEVNRLAEELSGGRICPTLILDSLLQEHSVVDNKIRASLSHNSRRVLLMH